MRCLNCEGNPLLPYYSLGYWFWLKRFREFYFVSKFNWKLRSWMIRAKNKNFLDIYNSDVKYNPDYPFYKERVDAEVLEMFM